MYLYSTYPAINLDLSSKEPVLKVLNDQPPMRVNFEPFENSLAIVSISYEQNPEKSILYSQTSSTSIFTLHLNEDYTGEISVRNTLRENIHLIKGIKLYHSKKLEILKDFHLERIKENHNYSRRDITEHALLKYSNLIRALTKEKF